MNHFHRNRPEMDTPEYKAWRYAVLGRDGFECQMCRQKGNNLQIHHIRKWSEYPKLRYLVSNGITLCDKCHDLVTGHEEKYEQQFKTIVERKKLEKQFKAGVKKKKQNQASGKTKYRKENPRLRF